MAMSNYKSKWGDPEILGETDLRGNLTPMSMIALQQAASQKAQDAKDEDERYAQAMARNRRIDYWARRGMASWQEPDYQGEDLAARAKTAEELRLDEMQRGGDIEGKLAETYEPGMYERKARGGAQAVDALAELAAKRYWDPMTHSMNQEQFQQKFDLATQPAVIAATSRADQAEAAANARIRSAEETTRGRLGSAAASMIPALIKSGAFGRDRKGNPIMPDEATQKAALDAIQGILGGVSGGGGADEKFDAQTEALIARGVNAGASRQEVIGYLRQRGLIPNR